MTLPLRVILPLTLAALVLAGCSVGGEAPIDPNGPAVSGLGPDSGGDSDGDAESEFDGSWIDTASKQVAKTLEPTPTYLVTSETAVTFTFPSASVDEVDALSRCQIAMGAIGMEYEITMSYPDGSVLCSLDMG